jgi:hypothetical protein
VPRPTQPFNGTGAWTVGISVTKPDGRTAYLRPEIKYADAVVLEELVVTTNRATP